MALSREKRNVLVLAIGQAIFNSTRALMVLVATLVSATMLGSDLTFVTAPITVMLVGTTFATLPASHFMQRFGRRAGFVLGGLAGTLGCAIGLAAVAANSFLWFNVGIFLFGIYSGFSGLQRFAAADAASPSFRARAISLVIAAGLVGAVVGPETAKLTRAAVEGIEFGGTMIALIGFTLAGALVALFVDLPRPTHAERKDTGRPLSEILKTPAIIVAMAAGMIGYVTMNLLMTTTPIAMRLGHGFHFNDAALVIEWHILGMFAPGLITGSLIGRFGSLRIITAGGLLLLLAVAIALAGTTLWHFWIAMCVLGIGWNFSFTGGTTLLAESHAPSERAKVQGMNDFVVFTFMAMSSMFSGTLYFFLGWAWVNYAALPMIALMLALLVWLVVIRRRATVPPVQAPAQ
jgi:MFS family permease